MTDGLNDAPGIDPSKLDILLTDYASLREDQRNYATSQISVITVIITTLTLLGGLVFTIHRNVAIPAPILAFAPAIVFVPLLLLLNMGADAIVRSFYMRALERTVRKAFHMSNFYYDWPKLSALSYSELSLAHLSLGRRPGHSKRDWMSVRVLVAVAIPTALIVLGGLTGYIALQVPMAWRSLMIVGYGSGAITLIIRGLRMSVESRQMFSDFVDSLNERLATPLDSKKAKGTEYSGPSSRLIGYLVLPRPDDLVKGLFLVMGVLLAQFGKLTVTVPTCADWISLLILWFITEILITQARYQWNDILGRREDQAAKSSETSNRLPDEPGAVGGAWMSIIVRIYLALTLVQFHWVVGPWNIRPKAATFVALALYLVIAIIYELVRAWIRREASCNSIQRILLLTFVGLGYPARFLVGWVATGRALDFPMIWMLVGLWALGVSFVGATWVLSGASYFNFKDGKAVSCDESKNIDAKPHIHAILAWVAGTLPDKRTAASPNVADSDIQPGGDFKFLKDSAVRANVTPWRLGTAVWLWTVGWTAGSLVGLLPASGLLILAAFFGGLIAMAPLPGRFDFLTQLIGPLLVLVAYAREFVDSPGTYVHVPQVWFRAIILLTLVFLASIIYYNFRNASYNATRDVMKKFVYSIVRVLPALADVVNGDRGPFSSKKSGSTGVMAPGSSCI